MIRVADESDLVIINYFLSKFNQKNLDCLLSNPFNKFVLYYLNDEPVGFMQYSLIYDRIELDYIYVLEEYRKKGIADALMRYLEEQLINNNITNISLEVSKNNIPAINLYKKYGFTEKAIRKNYYNGEDGLLLVREVK